MGNLRAIPTMTDLSRERGDLLENIDTIISYNRDCEIHFSMQAVSYSSVHNKARSDLFSGAVLLSINSFF